MQPHALNIVPAEVAMQAKAIAKRIHQIHHQVHSTC